MENNVQSERKGWDWAKHKPNNMYPITVTSDLDFFKWWLTLIEPFLKLTPREKEVVSFLLKQRAELARQIPPELVDSVLMRDEVKDKIMEECNLSRTNMYVMMHSLKKKRVISKEGINPRLIPNVRKDDNGVFQLLIIIKNEEGNDV